MFRRIEGILDFEFADPFVGWSRFCNKPRGSQRLHVNPINQDLLAESRSSIDLLAPLISSDARGEENEVLNLPTTACASLGSTAQRNRQIQHVFFRHDGADFRRTGL